MIECHSYSTIVWALDRVSFLLFIITLISFATELECAQLNNIRKIGDRTIACWAVPCFYSSVSIKICNLMHVFRFNFPLHSLKCRCRCRRSFQKKKKCRSFCFEWCDRSLMILPLSRVFFGHQPTIHTGDCCLWRWAFSYTTTTHAHNSDAWILHQQYKCTTHSHRQREICTYARKLRYSSVWKHSFISM